VKNHNLTESLTPQEIVVEQRPVLDRAGTAIPDLHNTWITLNNPAELNAYTTEMIKEIILALRGDRAFCTGGNTREYAEYYAGNPGEYRQYMRLFNDMVSAVLECDKPVICRVNGMRVGGGQEVGMACDFSVASDLAVFSQAGPKHGSVPDGGSTDFLPVYIGIENAMMSGTLCEPWSAHRFYHLGGLTRIVPALKLDGQWRANPLVVTERLLDEYGRVVLGEWKTGADYDEGKALLSKGTVDLSLLDQAVDELCSPTASPRPSKACVNTSSCIGTVTARPTALGSPST
jgi:6-oxo-cyclohex-1-ene-carbonyl-CoA hydrolase